MKAAQRITQQAASMGVIAGEDRELYTVILESLKYALLTWATLLIMGLLTDCLFGCVVFLVLYLPLRIFSGGFHCNSRKNCYILSLVIFTTMIGIYKFTDYAPHVTFDYALWVSAVAIFCLAPVQDPNKPLSAGEARHYRKVARGMLLIQLAVLAIVQIIMQNNIDSELLFFSAMPFKLLAIQLILGARKNKVISKKRLEI